MHDRQPGFAAGIEAFRRDFRQLVRIGFFAVQKIDLQQQGDRRLSYKFLWSRTGSAIAQYMIQPGLHQFDFFVAETWHLRQASVMGRNLERFQRIDMQHFDQAVRQGRPDAGNLLE